MDLTDQLTISILDFYQEEESREALKALRDNLKFKCNIWFYDNGTPKKYSKQFLEEGLVDKLIVNPTNIGCGPATVQMYNECPTPYMLYHQSDQALQFPITADQMLQGIAMLQEYSCIDLAGNQGQGRFSERANLMDVEFYKSIPKGTLGGPGITNDQKYVEEWVQDYFVENNYKIAHIQPTYFKDNGYYSVRQLAQDDVCLKHSCYTKETWNMSDEPIKRKYDVYPPLNEKEWGLALDGRLFPKWGTGVRGYIPEGERQHSFTNREVEERIEKDVYNNIQ